MPSFYRMKIRRIVEAGAVFQLARMGLQRRRRVVQRRQRRNRSLGLFALAAGAFAAWAALRLLRPEVPHQSRWPQEPQPSRKKLAREARRAEAARRAHEPATVRPPVIHVEREASTDLKVPLKDLTQ